MVLSAEEDYIVRVETFVSFLEHLIQPRPPHVPEMPEPHSLAALVVALEACVLAVRLCTTASIAEINSHQRVGVVRVELTCLSAADLQSAALPVAHHSRTS